MAKAVSQGKFREDLYYRLSGVQIPVPPLRSRGGDIVLLAQKFAADSADKYKLPCVSFDESAQKLLLNYRWPGNVRQLKNVIEQVAIFEAGAALTEESLKEYLPATEVSFAPVLRDNDEDPHSYARERDMLFSMLIRMQNEIEELKKAIHPGYTAPHNYKAITAGNNPDSISPISRFHRRTDDDFTPAETIEPQVVDIKEEPLQQEVKTEENEKEIIRRTLEKNDGKRSATAKELKMTERALYKKIKEYGLDTF